MIASVIVVLLQLYLAVAVGAGEERALLTFHGLQSGYPARVPIVFEISNVSTETHEFYCEAEFHYTGGWVDWGWRLEDGKKVKERKTRYVLAPGASRPFVWKVRLGGPSSLERAKEPPGRFRLKVVRVGPDGHPVGEPVYSSDFLIQRG